MRKIKFRAWKYGSFNYIGSNYDLPYWSCSGAEGEETTLSKLGWKQFTGLTDKNGAEIYEGDIISDHVGIGEVKHSDKHAAFRVVYGDGMAKWFHDYNLKGERESIEVIGNIHQNPELLEQ